MASRALGFCLLGWRRPHSQHDAAEFLDFLLPKLVPCNAQLQWEARFQRPGGVRRDDGAALNRCLSLSGINPAGPELQQVASSRCGTCFNK